MREALQMNDGNSIGMQIAQGVEKLLPSQQFLDDKLRPLLSKLPRPNLPDIRLPSVELPRPALPSLDFSGPTGDMPSVGSLGVGVVFALTVAVLFLLGLRLYRMRSSDSVAAFGGRQPAMIRFDPNLPIRSRHDLIRAFEQLSMHQLGVQAENWNHRAIAAQLGEHSAPRRRAAETLAQFYEMARYAPETENMTPESLNVAQRNIQLLAGGADCMSRRICNGIRWLLAAACLWVGPGTGAQDPLPPELDNHAFRLILSQSGMEPLNRFDEVTRQPERTILIVFGQIGVVEKLPVSFAAFLAKGGRP